MNRNACVTIEYDIFLGSRLTVVSLQAFNNADRGVQHLKENQTSRQIKDLRARTNTNTRFGRRK